MCGFAKPRVRATCTLLHPVRTPVAHPASPPLCHCRRRCRRRSHRRLRAVSIGADRRPAQVRRGGCADALRPRPAHLRRHRRPGEAGGRQRAGHGRQRAGRRWPQSTQPVPRSARGASLQRVLQEPAQGVPQQSRRPGHDAASRAGAGLRFCHLSRRLRGHQQPRRRRGLQGSGQLRRAEQVRCRRGRH